MSGGGDGSVAGHPSGPPAKRSESPSGRPTGLEEGERGRGPRADAVHEPRPRAGRGRTVVGGERASRLVHPARPTLRGPALRHARDDRGVFDPVRVSLDDEIELAPSRRSACSGGRARGCAPCGCASPVWNQKASSTHDAPIPVTCGDPSAIPAPTPPDAPVTIATRPADRKSTRLNSSHGSISYAVFCLKK